MSKLRYILIIALLLISISLVVTGCMDNSTSLASRYPCVDQGNGSELSTQELVAEVALVVITIVTETVDYK
jgi:hypothetical protein